MTTGSPTSTSVTPGPTSSDAAGALVAADHRVRDRQVAGDQVLVGVAQAARGELHEHLAGARSVELDLLDLPLAAGFPEHRRRGLHGTPA